MSVSIEKLQSLGLVRTHELGRRPDGRLRFKVIDGAIIHDEASVYVWCAQWVSDGDTSLEALYGGKAGRGIASRLKEHEGGFVHSGTGRANAHLLEQAMERGARIFVFTRKSDQAVIFGQTVSLYSAEEDALCKELRPSINRAAFPDLQLLDAAD